MPQLGNPHAGVIVSSWALRFWRERYRNGHGGNRARLRNASRLARLVWHFQAARHRFDLLRRVKRLVSAHDAEHLVYVQAGYARDSLWLETVPASHVEDRAEIAGMPCADHVGIGPCVIRQLRGTVPGHEA